MSDWYENIQQLDRKCPLCGGTRTRFGESYIELHHTATDSTAMRGGRVAGRRSWHNRNSYCLQLSHPLPQFGVLGGEGVDCIPVLATQTTLFASLPRK